MKESVRSKKFGSVEFIFHHTKVENISAINIEIASSGQLLPGFIDIVYGHAHRPSVRVASNREDSPNTFSHVHPVRIRRRIQHIHFLLQYLTVSNLTLLTISSQQFMVNIEKCDNLERVMSHFKPHSILFCVLSTWIKYV